MHNYMQVSRDLEHHSSYAYIVTKGIMIYIVDLKRVHCTVSSMILVLFLSSTYYT